MRNTLFVTFTMLIFNACGTDGSMLGENTHAQQNGTNYVYRPWTKNTVVPTKIASKNVMPHTRKHEERLCRTLTASECGSVPYCATMESEVCSQTRCDINHKCIAEEYLTQQANCAQTSPESSLYFCSEEENDNVQCHSNSDCPSNQHCINFICTPSLNGCTSSDECNEDSPNVIGTQNVFQMCSTNDDCSEGLVCQRNHCLPDEMANQENFPGNNGNY